MYGNMYPIFGHETTWSDRVRERGFGDYIRWEYRPADRESVAFAATRGIIGRRRQRRAPRGLKAWLQLRRAAKGARTTPPPEAGPAQSPARN